MTSSVLKMQHTSLQYSDTKKQQYSDVEKLFAKGKQFPIKTGTEAGRETFNYDALKHFAKEFNHVFHQTRGNWIAVDRRIIKPGTLRRGNVMVAQNELVVGQMHDRVFATLAFTHADIRMGRVALAAAHYPRRGAKKGDPNYHINKLYAERLSRWMRTAARGSNIAFVNGDFNMPDNKTDWAFGANWTSMADELKAWQNTGHGPIDGFASFDRDGRVKAKKFEVLDDKKLHMHTDHFICRGTWTVRHLKV